MKVILLQDVKKVGKKDQVIEVSDGYAINFLIARKLAVQVTTRSKEILDHQQEEARINEEKAVAEAKVIAEKLKNITVEFTAKTGTSGKLFGTISAKQISEELETKYGIVVDKRKFIDKSNVDTLGFHRLKIELHKGVVAEINVHVSEAK